MQSILIRDMQRTDLDFVVEMEQESHILPWSYEIFKDCLNGDNYKNIVFILEEEIIGFGVLSIVLTEAEILNFCIHSDKQNKGYGSVFLKKTIEILRNHTIGLKKMMIRVL